ncbi:MAG: HAMP domain-containing histidine kinase [Firmicutes bacterium]|nr:HAMP domain-containing histidine kinase [Bacillota bacterium]
MKRVQTKFALFMILTVIASSLLAALLSIGISGILAARGNPAALYLGFALKEILTPAFTVLIATMIVAAISKKAVSPVVELSNATKEIASGNFDITINYAGRKDELGQLSRNFMLMARELKTNEYLARDFITNVSHEFRTPLAIISGYTELLDSDDITKEERRDYIQKTQSETERLTRLVSYILNLSRLDNRKIQEQPKLFSLDEQIRQAVLSFEPQWRAKGIRLDVDLPEINYSGNEDLLAQVWSNILDNAVKFTGEKGAITVRMRSEGGAVNVEIADSGIGMDRATRERVFERFYQGDCSRSSQGNGLGLALAKGILDVLEGSITVDSERGAGSTFKVTIPEMKQAVLEGEIERRLDI